MAIPQNEAEVVARVAALSRAGIPIFRAVDPNEPMLIDAVFLEAWEARKDAPVKTEIFKAKD